MNFAFSEEQEQLREFVRQFLDNYSDEAIVRELMETEEGYNPETWSMMAEQLGLQSLIIPEEYGGQGFQVLNASVRRRACGVGQGGIMRQVLKPADHSIPR